MNENFAHSIEEWYLRNRRDLPWRDTTDPYRIWVSEIILQQTRVAQGMEYYHRFIQWFPDVASLAKANEDEVLRLWQGLGYYSRARNMHKAARQVVEHGGKFPHDYEGIRRLAGIGDYTAAAIASFAYGHPYAVLDGNVYRVLSRTQGIDTPIDSTAGRKFFAQLAQEFLDERQPALYNQAIMDFGALQCTPKGCDCQTCPLRYQCVAHSEGRVEELPVKSHKVSVRNRHLIYIYIHEIPMNGTENESLTSSRLDLPPVAGDPQMLIRRRSKGDIWEGLYELPLIELSSGNESQKLPNTSWINALVADGAKLTLKAQGVRHQLTHQSLNVDFYELSYPGKLDDWLLRHPESPLADGFLCIHRSSLDRYALPRLLLQLFE